MGAARLKERGPAALTMTAADGIETARAFPSATIVPVHYHGWAHFSENRDDISNAFAKAGLSDRLRWLDPSLTSTVFGVGHFVFYDLGFFSSLGVPTRQALTGCITSAGMPSVA